MEQVRGWHEEKKLKWEMRTAYLKEIEIKESVFWEILTEPVKEMRVRENCKAMWHFS